MLPTRTPHPDDPAAIPRHAAVRALDPEVRHVYLALLARQPRGGWRGRDLGRAARALIYRWVARTGTPSLGRSAVLRALVRGGWLAAYPGDVFAVATPGVRDGARALFPAARGGVP